VHAALTHCILLCWLPTSVTQVLELNASDTRNKREIESLLSNAVSCQAISSGTCTVVMVIEGIYVPLSTSDGSPATAVPTCHTSGCGDVSSATCVGLLLLTPLSRSVPPTGGEVVNRKRLVIMDEVDGMGGSDRGGIAELIKVCFCVGCAVLMVLRSVLAV
jgi:hypothetical protein